MAREQPLLEQISVSLTWPLCSVNQLSCSLTVTENCLGSNPEPEVIVAAKDDMALGAVEAAKACGLGDPIIGFDALPEALLAVMDGSLYGTVEQFPGGQSRAAQRTRVDFLTNGARPANEVTLLSPKLITMENIYEAEWSGVDWLGEVNR
jgi:ABC-type sugar transport system substrate-binding protein